MTSYNSEAEARKAIWAQIPAWYKDRAVFVVIWRAGYSERLVPAPDSIVVTTTRAGFRRDGRCFVTETATVTQRFDRYRTGRRAYVLTGRRLAEAENPATYDDVREWMFINAYYEVAAEAARRVAEQAIAGYLNPDIVKELLKAFPQTQLFGNFKERLDIDALVAAIAKGFKSLAQARKEVDLLLSWLGRVVAEWPVKDVLWGFEQRTIGTTTRTYEVECTPELRGLPAGGRLRFAPELEFVKPDKGAKIRGALKLPEGSARKSALDKVLGFSLETASSGSRELRTSPRTTRDVASTLEFNRVARSIVRDDGE